MRTIRLTPHTLPGDDRRRFPWRDGSRSAKVPIVSEGEWLEGRFDVPARLKDAQPHTNDWHEFTRIVGEATTRWLEYRKLRGWQPISEITWRGPYEVPRRTEKDEAETEIVHFFLVGKFRTSTPLYVGLDDVLFERDRAARFEVDANLPKAPVNDLSGDYDSGWVDPMKHARETTLAMGIDPREYRLPVTEDGDIVLPQRNPGVNPL